MSLTGSDAAGPGQLDLFGLVARFAPLIFLVVLMAGFAIAEPRFLSTINLFNVLRQVSIYRADRDRHDLRDPDRRYRPVGRLAAGLRGPGRRHRRQGRRHRQLRARPVEAAGLRLGRRRAGRDRWSASLAAAMQGFAITRLKVPPFVVTLGGMSAFRGAALLFSGGGPISGFDEVLRVGGARASRAVPCR